MHSDLLITPKLQVIEMAEQFQVKCHSSMESDPCQIGFWGLGLWGISMDSEHSGATAPRSPIHGQIGHKVLVFGAGASPWILSIAGGLGGWVAGDEGGWRGRVAGVSAASYVDEGV